MDFFISLKISKAIEHLSTSKEDKLENGLISSSCVKIIRNLELLKLDLIQIVSSAPEYLTINQPDPDSLPIGMYPINKVEFFEACRSKSDILNNSTYQKLHFLPAVVLNEIHACLLHS